MNQIFGLFLAAVISATATLTQAKTVVRGVEHSGGGKAVVCRNKDESIKSVEMLDLFEGRALYDLKLKVQGESYAENLEGIRKKLRATFKGLEQSMTTLDEHIDQVLKNFRLLPADMILEPVNDAMPVAKPKGCTFEQAAVYQSENLLLVDQEIWNAMDNVNKVALIIHEAVYLRKRIEGDTNSLIARKVVAHLFSDFVFTPVLEGIPDKVKYCYAQKGDEASGIGFSFLYYIDGKNSNSAVLQFTYFRRHLPFDKLALSSLQWPWPEDYSDIGIAAPDYLENIAPVILRRAFDSDGKLTGYYFDETDGRYNIKCSTI